MERLNKIKGYYNCQEHDCNFKSKTTKHLIYFHGKIVCHHCKLRLSDTINIPKLNIKDSSLRTLVGVK